MVRLRFLLPLLLILCAGCATQMTLPSRPAADDFGVLLMAHGGASGWDRGVLDAVAPLRKRYPIEVAFGMADAVSLQAAVRKLEAQGVRRIGVVRLFVSGESWYERTEQILGLRAGAPAGAQVADHDGHGGHGGHSMAFWRVAGDSAFAMSTQGLAEAPAMGAALADRAQALSREPAREDVLILAHGPGDDEENMRWIADIDDRAEAVRARLPFRRVVVMTLREDWPEKRSEAEARIRAFVRDAAEDGGRAIVVPFRVQGFGPYAKVLHDLEYVSDGQGLIPHPAVTAWVAEQAEALRAGRFRRPEAASKRAP